MTGPALKTVCDDISALATDVHMDSSTPDLFFFKGGERMMPFATIIARDTDFDAASRLDREGVFRLNIGLDAAGFRTVFPQYASRKALETLEIDFAALDTLMPHPVYGRMHWVCVLNPDRTYGACRELLATAYARARG